MRLLEGLLELIAPTRCAGCESPGDLLCDACLSAIKWVDPALACPHCGAPFGYLVCTECWHMTLAFEAGLAAGELDGALARAIVLHKDAGERRLGDVLGGMVARRACERWPQWPDAVTWIPPTKAAIARRGFDHGHALALPVARRLGVAASPLLRRERARDQRELSRSARQQSARESFLVEGPVPAKVLVVDDVLTTGATLDAAAAALLAAGAASVRVAVVARAW